jgi:hypothetical protein
MKEGGRMYILIQYNYNVVGVNGLHLDSSQQHASRGKKKKTDCTTDIWGMDLGMDRMGGGIPPSRRGGRGYPKSLHLYKA